APLVNAPEPARSAAARPAPAAKPSPAIKPASPPPAAARQPVTPQPRPTAPIMGARPSSAPVSAARSVSAPPTVAQVPKLLKETEVYVKYGLHDKALEHLRRILSVDPNNIDAHEKAKIVALAMGRTDDAIQTLTTMLRLCTEKRDRRAAAVRAELKELGSAGAGDRGGLVPEEAALVVGAVGSHGAMQLEAVAGLEVGQVRNAKV